MVEITKQYVKEVNEVKELCIKSMSANSIKYMDTNALMLLQACLKVIDTQNTMLVESAELMEKLDRKMELLLTRK